MILHFLKEDSLAALKTNVWANIKLYENKTNDWIYEYFDGESPFAEYKDPVSDFQMQYLKDGSHIGRTDVENSIQIYRAMMKITDTQAADERFWAGLCHGDFWDYMHNRWENIKVSGDMVSSLLWRYFYNTKNGIRRAMFRNTLSRLWWLGRLTYDENRNDPFELTRYWEEDFSTKMLILFSSNYMGNQTITRGLVSALMELERQEVTISGQKRELYYLASQYLNLYGGTHILDYYSENEIKEKVMYHIKRLAVNSRRV